MAKDKNGGNVPHLEITEVLLVYCNNINNSYQQDSWVLYAFDPNKSFGPLLDISPKNFVLFEILPKNFQILKCGLLIRILCP